MSFDSTDNLTLESLRDLAGGATTLIRHAGFYPPESCRSVLPRIVEVCEAASYTITSDFQSIGTSMGEACESEKNEQRYLSTAAKTTAVIRDDIFIGSLSPLDRLRLLLDELWPFGTVVAHHNGRMLLPGIIRRWPTGGHANPHIDERNIPLLAHYDLRRRIGVNIYLEVPPPGQGGDVDFWWTCEPEEYQRLKRPDYGLDRDALGPPRRSCRPSQGELLMFDAACIHAVRRLTGGSRVTAACFIGVRSENEPLVVFA